MGIDNISPGMFDKLMPYASEQTEKAKLNSGLNLVHYTSSEALINILNSREIWLRNAATMNDYSEIEYGLKLIDFTLESEIGNKFKKLIEELHPGIGDKLSAYHGGWKQHYERETYLLSVSEHPDSEDQFGRLSMWREYARQSGVAFVIHKTPFETETNLLKAYTVPVMYADQGQFSKQFEEITEVIDRHRSYFSDVPFLSFFNSVFQVLRFMTVSTKHPGFEEEMEWRVVHHPSMESSPHIQQRVEIINGVPQKICALSLKEISDGIEKLDLSLDSIVRRVIIGPTNFKSTIIDAVSQALGDAGVKDADARVGYSEIPVRT